MMMSSGPITKYQLLITRVKVRRAFTLVELLVTISIISILATVGYVMFGGAIERSRIGRAQADLETLKTAMNMYFQDVGELPPRGDCCSACSACGWPSNCSSRWASAIDALLANDGVGWDGPYLDKRIDTDPWGRCYAYDDNYSDPHCPGCPESCIISAGPNGVLGDGDDIKIIVLRDND